MESQDATPYDPDAKSYPPNCNEGARFRTTFAIDATALHQLVFELDRTPLPELVADDNFEAGLCELVCKQISQYELPTHQRELIEALNEGMDRVTKDSVEALSVLLLQQENDHSLVGSEVAHTEMLLGICYDRLRMTDQAIKSLRSALTRFQQTDDEATVYGVMVENLCRLSEIYRTSNKKDAARDTIKQASRILPFANGDWNGYYRVLAEMAALLAATGNYEPAITAYRRLLKAKAEVGRKYEKSTIDILIQLTNIYHTMHRFDLAEQALICAGSLFHQLPEPDEKQFVEIVQKLSGVLFQQGQFKQSEFVSERANQIIGRGGTGPSHQLLGDLMTNIAYQRESGNHAEAKKLYRAALTTLEAQREKRIIDRLPILAGIFILTEEKQQLQRASLIGDMEVSLNQFFCGQDVPIAQGMLKVASMFNFLGYNAAANELRLAAEEISHSPYVPIEQRAPQQSLLRLSSR